VHPTALGRALLAFAPPSLVELTFLRGLRAFTPHTITAPDRLRRALAVVRLTRVAVTRFEFEAGACGVAVPVFGAGGELVAAIELTVPDLGRDLQAVVPALTIAARSLSRELAGGAGVQAAPAGGMYPLPADDPLPGAPPVPDVVEGVG
jgi:DNA-binding IclR family transcriptional regulator